MAVFMNDRFLNEVSPIVKDKLAWDAFLAILAFEENKTLAKLNGPKDIEEAQESDFCDIVVGPFEASDRDEALKIVEEQTA